MNDIGYIKLWRKFRDDGLWKEKREFSKFEAWLDILSEVNFKKKEEIIIGNQILDCDRGQSIKSLESWQERWNWKSKYKVRVFLKLLEKTNKICIENKTVTTRISVCNYGKYQDEENTEKTEAKRKQNTSKTQAKPIEEYKKRKESKEVSNKSFFDDINIIVNYMNSVLKTSFKTKTVNTNKFITARLNEGFKVSDFIVVIDKKYNEWSKDVNLCKYLRPETLFGTKFESYLNQKEPEKPKKKKSKFYPTPKEEEKEVWGDQEIKEYQEMLKKSTRPIPDKE